MVDAGGAEGAGSITLTESAAHSQLIVVHE
jgi:hypothetical protein